MQSQRTATLVALLATAMALASTAQQPNLTQADAAMRAGIAAANANDLPKARLSFARAAALAPKAAAPHAALGSILLAQQDFKAALPELQRAHTLDPADASATLNLAHVESALAHHSTALPLFREALTAPTPPTLSPEESIAFANTLAATNHPSEAQSQLTQSITKNPDNATLEATLGSLLAQSNHPDQALPHFERAVTLDPTLPQAQYLLGVTRLILGQPQAAIQPLQQAVAAAPASFEVHLQLGRALSATHHDQEALTELHRAAQLRTSQTPIDATYALALALEASGDAPASIPLFAAATAAPKTDPAQQSAALINYALALVQTGDAKAAVPLYAQALTLGPDSPTLREDYGVAFLQQADLDQAILQFQAGLAFDQQNPHLHHDLGLAYKLKDDLTHAVAELQLAAKLDPTLPDPAYTLGVIYMQQGQFPEAAAELRQVTSLQPTNGEAWSLLGSVLKDSDNTTEAIAAFQHATTLRPDQPNLHVQLAALLIRTGHPDQALAERKLAAELSRTAVSHQHATFALKSGRTLLAEGKLPEAILQLNAATDADPKLAEPHTLLAEALFRQGKLTEAALERRRAADLQAPALTPTP
jgi:protein O-GlcNAc transferase